MFNRKEMLWFYVLLRFGEERLIENSIEFFFEKYREKVLCRKWCFRRIYMCIMSILNNEIVGGLN